MADRLVDERDLERFNEILHLTLNEHFGDSIGQSIAGDGSLFFGDFCGQSGDYQRIRSLHEVSSLLSYILAPSEPCSLLKPNVIFFIQMELVLLQSLEEYNITTNASMNLVLFEDAMSHICRISRILRQARGNALLLGMGGSGEFCHLFSI